MHLLIKLHTLSHVVAYLNMGSSLVSLGRCNEAAKIFREGSKLNGHGVRDRHTHDSARMSMLLQLGSLYSEQGKLQKALAIYREALHSLPKNYPPQVSCGVQIRQISPRLMQIVCV